MANICKMCGCELYGNETKIKGGSICAGCASTLPKGVRESGESFNVKQLQAVNKIAKRWKNKPNLVWKRSGTFRVCPSSVVLNDMEYQLKDIRSLQLNFHPKDIGGHYNTATGIVSIVIETKSPHLIIEEAISNTFYEISYIISGMNITYHYSKEIEYVIQCIQNAIRQGRTYIEEAVNDLEAAKRAAEEKRRKAREAKARQEREAEAKRKAEEQRASFNKSGAKTRQNTPLENALRMYGLKQPFSVETLKKRRVDLLKSQPIHPDNGGTNERFREFQAAYELLLRFTVG